MLTSTEKIRALTTKIVKAAQVQKSVQAAGVTGAGSSVPLANGNVSGKNTVERSTTKSAPAAEPLPASVKEGSTTGGGGVEETKVNGPPPPPGPSARDGGGEGGKGGNSSSKSSKKKNRR